MLKRLRPCCVPGCKDKTSKRYYTPTDKNIRRIWIERLKNEKLLVSEDETFIHNSSVCKTHFHEMCFDDAGRLKKYSLPILHLPHFNNVPCTEDTCFSRPESSKHSEIPKILRKIFKTLPNVDVGAIFSTTTSTEDDSPIIVKVQKPARVYTRSKRTVFTPLSLSDKPDSTQHASSKVRPDGTPTSFLGLESGLEPPTKLLKILPKPGSDGPSRIATTSSPATSYTPQCFSSNEGSSSLPDAAFEVSVEELVIEQEPDDSLGRFEDPLSLDEVTVKNEPETDNLILNSTSKDQHELTSSTNNRLVIPIQDVTVIKTEPDEELIDSSAVTEVVLAQKVQNYVVQNKEIELQQANKSNFGLALQKHSDSSSDARIPQKSSKEKCTLADFREEDMKNPQDAVKFYRLATNENQLLLDKIKKLEEEVKCLRLTNANSDNSTGVVVRRKKLLTVIPDGASLKRKAESEAELPQVASSSCQPGERQEIKTKERHRDQIIILRRPSKP